MRVAGVGGWLLGGWGLRLHLLWCTHPPNQATTHGGVLTQDLGVERGGKGQPAQVGPHQRPDHLGLARRLGHLGGGGGGHPQQRRDVKQGGVQGVGLEEQGAGGGWVGVGCGVWGLRVESVGTCVGWTEHGSNLPH